MAAAWLPTKNRCNKLHSARDLGTIVTYLHLLLVLVNLLTRSTSSFCFWVNMSEFWHGHGAAALRGLHFLKGCAQLRECLKLRFGREHLALTASEVPMPEEIWHFISNWTQVAAWILHDAWLRLLESLWTLGTRVNSRIFHCVSVIKPCVLQCFVKMLRICEIAFLPGARTKNAFRMELSSIFNMSKTNYRFFFRTWPIYFVFQYILLQLLPSLQVNPSAHAALAYFFNTTLQCP